MSMSMLHILHTLLAFLLCRRKTKRRKTTRQLSDLGVDLVTMIEERLVLYIDKVRFRAVCKLWNCIPPKLPNHQNKQVPWLFFRFYNDKEASHGLFDLVGKKIYRLNLAEVVMLFIEGSSNGWVATSYPCIYLTNPLTGSKVELPSINEFNDADNGIPNELPIQDNACINLRFLHKILLSSSPLNDDCLVFAIYSGCRLAYCWTNDDKWTSLSIMGNYIRDIIFHKGKLHALLFNDELLVLENIDSTELTRIPSNIGFSTSFDSRYLVESSEGELMLVVRIFTRCPIENREGVNCSSKTSTCEVYKLDAVNLRWVMVNSIGDDVMFVGKKSSTSISCRDFPGFNGNRIYFYDSLCQYYHYREIAGVFNLDDGTTESLMSVNELDPAYVGRTRVWFAPSLV